MLRGLTEGQGRATSGKRSRAETDPMVDELLTDYFDPSVAEHREVLAGFLDDQENFVNAVLDYVDTGESEQDGGVTEVRENVA